MRPGDPRDMLEVPTDFGQQIVVESRLGRKWAGLEPRTGLTVPELAYMAATGRVPRSRTVSRRRAALRLVAAFALGLVVGLLVSDVRAASRPAPQSALPGALAEGRTGAPYRDIGVPASMPSPATGMRPAPTREPLPALTRSGLASYYDAGRGLYAALPGPWRAGRLVAVCAFVGGTARCATAPVVTTCGCGGPPRKVIDLSPALMERITGWTAAERRLRGVVRVTVEVL